MKSYVIPTVFAANKEQFDARLEKLVKASKNIQIDFMDGEFVPLEGVDLDEMPNLQKYKRKFEAHLMCKFPEIYIDKLAEKGFYKAIVHYEAISGSREIKTLLDFIKGSGLEAWIAINPETDIWEIAPYLHHAEGILVMGVHPGKEKQKLIHSIIGKIKDLREMNHFIKIQVDGGVNIVNASLLRKAGANLINSGSFVSDAKNPKIALQQLNKAFLKD
jgi:ribulose-phosphate 3-epimerase